MRIKQSIVKSKSSHDLELELTKLKNDVQRYKNKAAEKDAEVIRLRGELNLFQESLIKTKVNKEKENIKLYEAIDELKKDRDSVQTELEKTAKKMLTLQKIFDESAMQIEQLKREKEKFEWGASNIDDMKDKIDTLEAQLSH